MDLSMVETILIVLLENRSFDHMLGYLSLPGTPSPLPLDGLKGGPWLAGHANLYAGGRYVPHLIRDQGIDDPPHDRERIAMQIQTPLSPGSPERVGGFVASYMTANPPPSDPSLVMGYLGAPDVPTFDFLARNFAVCDRWYASLPSGTQANRLMAMSGESLLADNSELFLPEQDLVYDWLTARQVPWCSYQSGDFLPFFSLMPRWTAEIATSLTASSVAGIRGHFRRYSRFRSDWMDDSQAMPSVIFLEPEYTDGPHFNPNDDHSPTSVAPGQSFVADIYGTVIANPVRWQRALIIVFYDEHGGFFDHAPPLPVRASAAGVSFASSGVRVPALLISPYVAPGSVIHGNFDHTSILQLLADRFDAGRTYSAAVATRQSAVDPDTGRAIFTRLSDVLEGSARTVAPTVPDIASRLAAPHIASRPAVSPAPSPRQSPHTKAMWSAARKLASEHPDLLADPSWSQLRQRLAAP